MWQQLAEKARKQAAEMHSDEARESRLRVAEYFDRLAIKSADKTPSARQPSH